MIFEINDKVLSDAANEGMDAFVEAVANAIKEGVGGDLCAETIPKLNSEQITLLGYLALREEIMDGGFIQLIHNGWGPFFFKNPFAVAMKQWGTAVQKITGIIGNENTNLVGLGRMLRKVKKDYERHHERIEDDMSDEDFMALYEQLDVFEDYDDEFVSNEESYTEDVARYVDENLDKFVTVK